MQVCLLNTSDQMIGVIFLNYLRKEYSDKALQSISVQNIDFEVLQVEQKGISKAINIGLNHFFENRKAEYVFICANDIELPLGAFNKMIHVASHIPETGVSAIHCVESLPDLQKVNDQDICPAWGVFGNYLLTKAAFDKIGYWNEDQDPYGMNDSDYCYRLHKAGFLNYYIYGLHANHLGSDVHSGTDYRKMKDEGLNKAANIFGKWQKAYDLGNLYIPYLQEDYIIKMNQMYGEV
jgi:hypothetical protein